MRFTNRLSFSYCFLLLIVICTRCRRTATEDDQKQLLPTLWSSVLSDLEKSYHVLYQLETEGSEDLLIIEEWANYDRRLFRLDLVGAATRTTYLWNGDTREIFRYRPYVCDLLEGEVADLRVMSSLFLGYHWGRQDAKISGNPFIVHGLGPLWLRAVEDAAAIWLLPTTNSSREFDDQFNEFEVVLKDNLSQNQVAHNLHFFFHKGAQHFVDSIDWVSEWVQPPDANGKPDNNGEVESWVSARLKVLQVDSDEPEVLVFELPVGYGCARRNDLDHGLDLDIGLMLLQQGKPNQVVLDVVTSQPQDELLNSWTSQRCSLRWLRYSRPSAHDASKTESYNVMLTQTRSPQLKRRKLVWWAPDSSRGLALVYQIDQASGACQVSHRDVRDQINLSHLGADETDQAGDVLQEKPIALSADKISFLFADKDGYHLLNEASESRNLYYEKRLQSLKLPTSDTVAWPGPVSIVKRIRDDPPDRSKRELNVSIQTNERRAFTLSRRSRMQLIIFLYSEKFDKLRYKIVIDFLDNHEVSYAYVHEQLDISTCFESATADEADDGEHDSRQELVSIKYPLERLQLAKQLEEHRESIKTSLFLRLFTSEQITVSPLQVNSIQLNFDLFNLYVELTILNLPLTHLFERADNMALETRKLSSNTRDSALMETFASSAESCAEHCEHYNCRRFSYEPTTRTCTVALMGSSFVTTVEREGSQLYSYIARNELAGADEEERPHLSAEALVELFEQLVADSTAEENGKENPLVFEINLRPNLSFLGDDETSKLKQQRNIVTLVPSSLKHELESMNEYVSEIVALNENESTRGAKAEPTERVVRMSKGHLKQQFRLLMKDRNFRRDEQVEQLDGELLSFEDCEQRCEINSCRSFAYCAADESCQVTKAEGEDELEKMTRSAPIAKQCAIYSLDALSKFEPYGRVLKPFIAAYSIDGASARVCANTCLHTVATTCQGFYFCRPSPYDRQSAPKCHLIAVHVESFNSDQRKQHFHPIDKQQQQPGETNDPECSFYLRSHMAQFDKYRGRKLDLPAERSSGDTRVLEGSYDVEDCARRCNQLGCLAFDSCPVKSIGRAARTTLRCQMLLKGVHSGQLVRERRCSTFVLSDKSQFNAAKRKLELREIGGSGGKSPAATGIQPKPDEEARVDLADNSKVILDEGLEEAQETDLSGRELKTLERLEGERDRAKSPELTESSHWLARTLSFALGACVGAAIIAVWNEAYARNWLDHASSWRRSGSPLRFLSSSTTGRTSETSLPRV